jgi:CRISPR-associated protein Csb1
MSQENQSIKVTNELLNTWATDSTGPVALHLKQKLLPVGVIDSEDKDEHLEQRVIFPPTYADIGYNIDTLKDGTRVATIDSVGSQANRLEPVFKSESADRTNWLVPQIQIKLNNERTVSLLDLAHRAADAVVQSSPGLKKLTGAAFKSLQSGNAGPLCELAPTSLVFGVWDSRGDSGEKRPRLVRSIIRAWNVEPLHAAAQFNSVWKALKQDEQEELKKAVKEKDKEGKLSTVGLADSPAVFRKTKIKIPTVRDDGNPNPEARVLGGVIARGPVERQVTVNLIALRSLRGKDDPETNAIRKYLLGLSLMAATADIELFLREGCLLRYADEKDAWYQVPRRGTPTEITLGKSVIEQYVKGAANHFRPKWPEKLEFEFDLKEAKKLSAKKTEEEAAPGGS